MDTLGSYEAARREYKMAKAVLQGNFPRVGPPYIMDQYASGKVKKYINDINEVYEIHRAFVENVVEEMTIQFESPSLGL